MSSLESVLKSVRVMSVLALAFVSITFSLSMLTWASWQNFHIEQLYQTTTAQTGTFQVLVKIDGNFDLNRFQVAKTAFLTKTGANVWTTLSSIDLPTTDTLLGTNCQNQLPLAYILTSSNAVLQLLVGMIVFSSAKSSNTSFVVKLLVAILAVAGIGAQVFGLINYNNTNGGCFPAAQLSTQPATLVGGDGNTYNKVAGANPMAFRQPAVADFLTGLVGLFGVVQILIVLTGPLSDARYEKLEGINFGEYRAPRM